MLPDQDVSAIDTRVTGRQLHAVARRLGEVSLDAIMHAARVEELDHENTHLRHALTTARGEAQMFAAQSTEWADKLAAANTELNRLRALVPSSARTPRPKRKPKA